MSDIQVRSGGDFQTALNAAQPGDTVTLEAGAKFQGQFVFPPKAGNVTVRSSGTLPARRVGPGDAALMATIVSGAAMMACDFYDSQNWTLDGIRFEPNVAGAGEVIGIYRGKNIVLKRLLFDLPDPQQQKRFVLGNGQDITLTQSYVSGVWKSGQDSQAFCAWDGPGPYTITDNYLEAASENVMFGGADSSSDANRPKDILIENNHIAKRASWKGDATVQVIKNLIEAKDGSRIQVRNNRLQRCWGGEGQSGWAVMITPRNQNGSAPWTRVEDLLFEGNTIDDVWGGVNILGYDDINQSGQTTRIVVRDNTLTSSGTAFLVMNDAGRVEFYRNTVTIPGGGALLSLDKGQRPYAVRELVLASNIAPNTYIHSPTALNQAALQAYCETYSTVEPLPGPTPTPTPTPVPVPPDDMTVLKADVTMLKGLLGTVVTDVATAKSDVAATKSVLDALKVYLGKTPTATRIAQVVSYLRGASK